MGFQTFALGGNPGNYSGLNVTRVDVLAQATPTSIKLGQGNIYAIEAMVSGANAAYVQFFTHGGVTLGVTAPHFELAMPVATTTVSQVANKASWSGGGIPIPFAGTATTSGIWIAAGVAASTGGAVAADIVDVYVVWA